MALNIKDPETDRLTRELAALTGESITDALRRAVQLRLDRERVRRQVTASRDVLAGLVARGRARPVVDPRSSDEILGYDVAGLPG